MNVIIFGGFGPKGDAENGSANLGEAEFQWFNDFNCFNTGKYM